MVHPRQVVRAIVFALLLSVFAATSVSLALGQASFGLSVPGGLHTPSVNPGENATATIDLTAIDGFDSPVSLSCQVTSGPTTISPPAPVCGPPSPPSAIPPAQPALTVTTFNATPAGTYQFTLTGTSGSITQTAILYLNVTDLTENFALSVLPTTATPSPVPAGSPATTTVTVTGIGSYTGHQVTLSCVSITPIVAGAPVCSFGTPPTPVQVTSGVPATATLTITTFGPTTTGRLSSPRMFYALWLAVPGLVLVGASATGACRKKLMGWLLLLTVASGILFMPACNAVTTVNPPNGPNGEVTPNNTYTFTITGVDENGVSPSTTTPTTVTLAVN